jgi:AcrR family transcriptional regulator
MARKTRSPEVIEKVKENIIEEAMKLIIEVGFRHISVRKLAERAGMSATNLYYYYANKDEIYLNIQIKGFNALQTALEKADVPGSEPLETLRTMIRSYLEFGFNHPDYYQIMLNTETPRYSEYQGSKIEPVAFKAKQAAINSISVPIKAIEALIKSDAAGSENEIEFRAYQLWITLHGIVTLHNRNILEELNETPVNLINRMCDDLMLPFTQNL